MEYCYVYTAKGGSEVRIPAKIDPYAVLGVAKTAPKINAQTAFRSLIRTPNRQQRAIVSYAYHMLEVPGRYESSSQARTAGPVDWAISGHTDFLKRDLDDDNIKREDASGRTLLYLAARSGFYDTCEYLLQRGARNVSCGEARSTPLHAAAFFGHSMLCMLVIEHGASIKYKNAFGNSPVDEAMTPEIKHQLLGARLDSINVLSLSVLGIVSGFESVCHEGEVVAKLVRHHKNSTYSMNGMKDWKAAWHGTRMKNVASIFAHGLQASGTDVKGVVLTPPVGHYKLGDTHFGIKNWANAIFVSPSILYAGHPCYSERIISDGVQWCVLLGVYCKAGSYSSHNSTVTKDDPVDGEPTVPEWRVDVQGDDMIWRQSDHRCVVVTGALFVKLSFFEDVGKGGPSYADVNKLLSGF